MACRTMRLSSSQPRVSCYHSNAHKQEAPLSNDPHGHLKQCTPPYLDMADPLSIAASTVGIAAAGANISLTLYQFADKAGSAARDAKKIGHEISNLCAILHLLGTTLEEADEASMAPCASVAEEMNERCLKMFIEITELVQELERYIGHSGDNSFKWTERIKWALSKPRILYLRAGIKSYKTTLHLILMSLEWARRINKRR